MQKYKIIAIDLDDTLLLNNKTLEPKASKLIKKAYDLGIHVVITTGRGFTSAADFASQLEIDSPIISGNGARVTSSINGEKWLHSLVPDDISLEIAKFADNKKWDLLVNKGETLYRSKYIELETNEYNILLMDRNIDVVKNEPECIICNEQEALPFFEQVSKKYSDKVYLEVFYNQDKSVNTISLLHKNAKKGFALKFLATKLGVRKEEIIALGDNINDVSMFEFAGTSVAMGNAPENVKKLVNYVAPANYECGVAHTLEKYIF